MKYFGAASRILSLPLITAVLTTSVCAASKEEERGILKKLLINSEWSQSTSPDRPPTGVVVFRDLGKCTSTGWFADGQYTPLFYVIEASGEVSLYHKDPKNDRKGTPHWTMKVNLEEKTANNDPAKSTIPGTLSLKYKGPIKK
jgi:hypothetical protein